MTKDDELLAEQALKWVKENQKSVVAQFTSGYEPAPKGAVSIFMAGSPGAGKTEFSKRLVEQFGEHAKYIVRIDPDEIRAVLPCYVPGRAEVFQAAVSVAVEKIHDFALSKRMSFLLDGTFSNLLKAKNNVARSLDKKRAVLVEYVYQDPFIAWDFTQKREVIEGRNIPKTVFIDQFFAARENAMLVKKEYGSNVTLEVVTRNISTGEYKYWFNVDNIDSYLKLGYSREELEKKL